MVTDNRRHADGVPDKDGDENKLNVHENTVGGYAVFAGIRKKLEIIDHADNGRGNITHKFGRTVGTGTEQNATFGTGAPKAKETSVFRRKKIEQRQDSADTLADAVAEAYRLSDGVRFEGAYRRSDIGRRALQALK